MNELDLPDRATDTLAAECGVVIVSLYVKIPDETPCHYCGKPANTRDHIVAKTRGGHGRYWNLVPACQRCNLKKGHSRKRICKCPWCDRARALFDQGHRVRSKYARSKYPPKKETFVSRSMLPADMPEDQKEAYRYGWRRARIARSLDDAERRYADADRAVFNAFHEGYNDRASGYDFGTFGALNGF